MGDRCYLQMTLRRADLPRFAHCVHARPDETWWDDEDELDNKDLISVRIYEANYAWYDQREEAAAAGIPFFGAHGEGGEYAGCAFASLDGEQIEVYVDRDGMICVQIDERTQLLTDLGYIQDYLEKLRAVKELFGMPAAEAEGSPVDVNVERIERIGEHYLLHIVGDTEPDLHGPYPTKAVRDDAARRIKLSRGDEDGLYRLDMSAEGVPLVRPYGASELEVSREVA